jgi:hypothetical protein
VSHTEASCNQWRHLFHTRYEGGCARRAVGIVMRSEPAPKPAAPCRVGGNNMVVGDYNMCCVYIVVGRRKARKKAHKATQTPQQARHQQHVWTNNADHRLSTRTPNRGQNNNICNVHFFKQNVLLPQTANVVGGPTRSLCRRSVAYVVLAPSRCGQGCFKRSAEKRTPTIRQCNALYARRRRRFWYRPVQIKG